MDQMKWKSSLLLRIGVWCWLIIASAASFQLSGRSNHFRRNEWGQSKSSRDEEGLLLSTLQHGSPAKRSDRPESVIESDYGLSGVGGFLQIKEAPPKFLEARQHGKTILECSATGSPAPKVTWNKNGRPLFKEAMLSDSAELAGKSDESIAEVVSHLTLDCVSEHDAGVYECVAYNDLSDRQTVATELSVASFGSSGCGDSKHLRDRQRSPPVIYRWISTYMQTMGSEGLLPCSTEGKHHTQWYNPDDELIVDSDKYKILDNGDLLLTSMSFKDMGMFRCMVKNEYGTDMKETFVYPLAPMRRK